MLYVNPVLPVAATVMLPVPHVTASITVGVITIVFPAHGSGGAGFESFLLQEKIRIDKINIE